MKIICFISKPFSGMAMEVMRKQLLRCATSVGANYRATCRAKSERDFWYKIKIVEEEADEAVYWLELMLKSGLAAGPEPALLLQESRELAAIFTSAAIHARDRLAHPGRP